MNPGDAISSIVLNNTGAGRGAGVIHGNAEAVREITFDQVSGHGSNLRWLLILRWQGLCYVASPAGSADLPNLGRPTTYFPIRAGARQFDAGGRKPPAGREWIIG